MIEIIAVRGIIFKKNPGGVYSAGAIYDGVTPVYPYLFCVRVCRLFHKLKVGVALVNCLLHLLYYPLIFRF